MTFEDVGHFLPNKLICSSFTSLWDSFLSVYFHFRRFHQLLWSQKENLTKFQSQRLRYRSSFQFGSIIELMLPETKKIDSKYRHAFSWKVQLDRSNIKLSNFTIFRTNLPLPTTCWPKYMYQSIIFQSFI